MALQYENLKRTFVQNREEEYNRQRNALYARLESLLRGDDEEFLESLADLAEYRDHELVRLKVLEDYSVDKAERDLDERLGTLSDQYRTVMSGIRDKFLKRLESQAEQLKDKSTCEISSAGNGELSGPTAAAGGRRRSPVATPPVSANRQQRPRRSARGDGSGYESARSEVSRHAAGSRSPFADLFPGADAYATDVPTEARTDSAYTQPAYNKAGNRNPKFLPILTQTEIDSDVYRMKRRPE